jgi:hypothetical protein
MLMQVFATRLLITISSTATVHGAKYFLEILVTANTTASPIVLYQSLFEGELHLYLVWITCLKNSDAH